LPPLPCPGRPNRRASDCRCDSVRTVRAPGGALMPPAAPHGQPQNAIPPPWRCPRTRPRSHAEALAKPHRSRRTASCSAAACQMETARTDWSAVRQALQLLDSRSALCGRGRQTSWPASQRSRAIARFTERRHPPYAQNASASWFRRQHISSGSKARILLGPPVRAVTRARPRVKGRVVFRELILSIRLSKVQASLPPAQ